MKKKKISKKATKKAAPIALKPGKPGKPTLKKIRVGTSCQSGEIDSRKRYKVKIDDQWYQGRFTKEWFGWNFDDYGTSGMQLNLLDAVFEIYTPNPKKMRGRRPG